jgi:hypothetical protein
MQPIGIVSDYGWNTIVFVVGRGVGLTLHVLVVAERAHHVSDISKLFHSTSCWFISIITGRETEG